MKLYANQLLPQLKSKLAPIYLITGDESLLVDEACAQIRTAAQQKNFNERKSWLADNKFNWPQLLDAAQNLSLFAEQALFEIRFNGNKLTPEAKQILTEYAEHPPTDKILLLITEKLAANTLSAKWCKAIEKHGVIVQIWPISTQQLPAWIKTRLQQYNLTADPNVINFIADQVEGNLLAAKQEIEKLQLLYGSKHLTLDDVMTAIGDNARYDMFTLVDSALSGNGKQVVRIVKDLQATGTEPTLILWALTREIRTLIDLAQKLALEKNLEKLLQTQKVWEKRKPFIRQALKQHNPKSLTLLLKQASQIDQAIKGVNTENVWIQLTNLSLHLADIHS